MVSDVQPEKDWTPSNSGKLCDGMYLRPFVSCDKEEAFAKSSGYAYTNGYYSDGNGIVHLKGKSTKDLLKECNARIECVAFRDECV